MNTKNTGGPAFPGYEISSDTVFNERTGRNEFVEKATPGMTLRDYFAAQALIGYIAAHSGPDVLVPRAECSASRAYEFADAMLKAREE